MEVSCKRPWLVADLGAPHRMLSWSISAPGFVTARRVVWREVRNADLPPELDALEWFRKQMRAAGHEQAVGLITSRDISRHHLRQADVEGDAATCLVTAGMSNAERVGRRRHPGPAVGTINLLLRVNRPLSDAAMVEAMSVAVQARTLAVLEAGIETMPDGAAATGTGTDCVVVACPQGRAERDFAGLHTLLGEAAGAAVLDAMRAAVAEWRAEQQAGEIWQIGGEARPQRCG
ncbi:adenosylcobinamide amidohydrolase [Mesorhizobium sp. SP-1A]|uniref:adenosylcobinamide amidohydrolase n=1 Tax=Mesorhizobium sp. SP-1A TaxID=3077840 RepID=UPI0028F6D2D3|nr:adenosylcobinamide amidohydrolase [Mesorhizobium sp. SP-1A]